MYEQFYFMLYGASSGESASRCEALEQQKAFSSNIQRDKINRGARRPPDFQDSEFRGWQTIPAMRKLHNIAVWLRNSSIHSDLWEDRVGLRLGIDNDTRWNSWYKLIFESSHKLSSFCSTMISRSTIIFSTYPIGITLKKRIGFCNPLRRQLYGLRARIPHYRRCSQLWMVYYGTMKRTRFVP